MPEYDIYDILSPTRPALAREVLAAGCPSAVNCQLRPFPHSPRHSDPPCLSFRVLPCQSSSVSFLCRLLDRRGVVSRRCHLVTLSSCQLSTSVLRDQYIPTSGDVPLAPLLDCRRLGVVSRELCFRRRCVYRRFGGCAVGGDAWPVGATRESLSFLRCSARHAVA